MSPTKAPKTASRDKCGLSERTIQGIADEVADWVQERYDVTQEQIDAEIRQRVARKTRLENIDFELERIVQAMLKVTI